ncbi:MAG: hypothetical protein GX834_00375 [Clostridiaceae bacterium]|nr:hypothetical protein [Clostridiaceae bacterium]
MLSKRSARLVYALGVVLVVMALITNLTESRGVKTRTFLAVGNGFDNQVYLMIMLPLALLLAANILNLFLSGRVLRGIALAVNGLIFIWGIILFYLLEANILLKPAPGFFLVLSSMTFFIGTLKTPLTHDEE